MKKVYLSIIGLSFSLSGIMAQSANIIKQPEYTRAQYDVSDKSMIRFNTDITTAQQREQMNQDRLLYLNGNDPSYSYKRNIYEADIQNYIQNHPASAQNIQVVITIPVVVHVVYGNAAQNISNNQVFSQIQVMNEDFGRTNTDQNTHWAQAVNTDIQFCLAQQDPSGNPTTGIDRVSTTVTSFTTNDNVKSASTGGANAWDPTRYLNIWVCNLGAGLLGYGEFPTAAVSQTFGVVILYSAFGSNYTSYGTFATVAAPYDRGRTTTHEFSHCFNLYHIWGDDAGACSGSDLCGDTPNQADATTTCFAYPHTDACTGTNPGIMFENYMDYSYDNCMNLFTANQKTRMLAVLNTSPYNALQTSTGCILPVNSPPTALFSASTTSVCPGTPITFTDMSTSNTTSWSWTFPSGTPSTSTAQNPPSVTWSTPGTYTVTLVASNVNGNSTYTMSITVLGTVSPPLVEGFEAVTFPPANWTNYDAGANGMIWIRYAAGHNSSFSAKFDNYNSNVNGTRDELRTPKIDFSAAATVTMTFDVSHRRYSTTINDTLEVVVSTDCGATWTSVYLKGGTTLATVTGTQTTAFTPTNTQWRTETVNLNTYAGQSGVMVAFRNRGHYGNNIYVDNVNITTTASSIPNAQFTASTTSVCAGTAVAFTDASNNNPTSWTWAFPSGTPASATTQNVASVTWNTAGTYTVTHTATNASGTGTYTMTITVLATPTVTTTASSSTICSGSSTTLTASGASTYAWMPGSLTGTPVTVSPTTTTTYTVTGTGANGCSSATTRTITVNPSPTVTTTTTGATICSGNSTSMTASGASTYTWMPGSLSGTTVTVSPATTTTYTVTGTAANGCTSTSTRTITVNPTPTVTTTTTSTTICSGSSTTITASGATTYTWMPGSLSGSSVTVSPATTTTYTVTGTSTGCSGTSTRTITVNPSPTVTTTTTGATICSGNSTSMTASGASTYTWMPGSLSGATVTVSPATTTTYTVTGTAANGCTSTTTRAITVNPSPTVTSTASSTSICTGNSVTLTSSGASTYNWMPGSLTGSSVTVTPASTTTYTVTGTAANGCTGTSMITITVGSTPTVTATASSPSICNGGSTTLTGNGAVTYSWMPGSMSGTTITVSPTSTTTYTVTGTVAAGCVNTSTVTVTVNANPTVTATASNSSICAGSSTSITASGATTYNWMPGSLSGATITVTPTSSTTYTVTGTNAAGCTNTTTSSITVNALPAVTANASATTVCAGASVTLSGGGATTYTWDNSVTDGVPFAPSATTTYNVTGTDANGCMNTASVSVTVNANPVVNLGADIAQCGGSVTLDAQNAGSSYLWSDASTAQINVVTSSGTYSVTVTDANGCSGTGAINVTINSNPSVALGPDVTQCGGTVTLDAGNAGSTYVWSDATSSQTNVVSTSGIYYVDVTDANGCSGSDTVSVTININPSVTGSAASNTVCVDDASVALTGSPNGGTWSGPGVTGSFFDPNTAGVGAQTLTYDYTDANGCSGSATVVITVNACTGVAENSDLSNVSLMPNPSNGQFALHFHVNKSDDYVIEIHDILGQIVYREELKNFSGDYNHQIDLSHYGRGAYSIRLSNKENATVIRAITY